MSVGVFPTAFRYARMESEQSDLEIKVGAVLVVGKSMIKGRNKNKTHPKFANPEKHIRKTLHAELDCLVGLDVAEGGQLYVWRQVNGLPAMARPCEHCMTFIKESGVVRIYYTVGEFPYWRSEEV